MFLNLSSLRSPQWLAFVLIVGGGALLIWSGYQILGSQSGALPYARVVVENPESELAESLGLAKRPGLTLSKYEIRSEGIEKPLADFLVAQIGNDAPVPLAWHNQLGEPILLADANAEEAKNVAEAIAKHLPGDAVVYAWWDTSRRLKLLSDAPIAFSEVGPGNMFVPTVWQAHAGAIQERESTFWRGRKVSEADKLAFQQFIEALSLDVHAGTDKLRGLANGQTVYLVLNLLDAYKVGRELPGKFGIGFKDFARSNQAHGLIKGVKAWIKDNGHTAYSVYPVSDTVTRIYFLTDEPSKHTLLASLLPFNSSKPAQVPGTELVYQHRGYWIYKLSGSKRAEN